MPNKRLNRQGRQEKRLNRQVRQEKLNKKAAKYTKNQPPLPQGEGRGEGAKTKQPIIFYLALLAGQSFLAALPAHRAAWISAQFDGTPLQYSAVKEQQPAAEVIAQVK